MNQGRDPGAALASGSLTPGNVRAPSGREADIDGLEAFATLYKRQGGRGTDARRAYPCAVGRSQWAPA
jgi:hypothetical protein